MYLAGKNTGYSHFQNNAFQVLGHHNEHHRINTSIRLVPSNL